MTAHGGFQEDAVIASIHLGDSTKLKIRIVRINGNKRLDVRVFVNGSRYSGHTVKGFVLPTQAIPDLQAAIAKAADALANTPVREARR